MKPISFQQKLLIFLIVWMLSFVVKVEAQEISNHFAINLQGIIYAQQEDKSSQYRIYPVPQIEFLYRLYSFKKLSAYTGIQYSYSRWHIDLAKSEWKRKTHEIALPVFIKQEIGKYITVKGGANIGYLLKGKMEYRDNAPANPKWQDITDQSDYDESARLYMELFFTPKIKYDFDSWNSISLGPTIKHQLIEHWMEGIRPKTMYGVTLEYLFRF